MIRSATRTIALSAMIVASLASHARAEEPIAGELSIAPATALAVRGDLAWLGSATTDGVGAGLSAEGRWAPLSAMFVGLSADTRLTWFGDETGTAAGRFGLGRVALSLGTGTELGRVPIGAHLRVAVAPSKLGLQTIDAGETALVFGGVLELGWQNTRYALRAAIDAGVGVDDGASAYVGGRIDATRNFDLSWATLAGLELRGGVGVGVSFRGRLGVVIAASSARVRLALAVGAGGAEPLVVGLEVGILFTQRAEAAAPTSPRLGVSGQ